MDHITAFPRPAAPELPPHRLRSCQDCRTFPESQWMLSIGCFLFCILRDDRTIRAIPFGRSALLHCAITFFCRSRCRSQNDKPAVPLSGEIEAFFLESDPSSASTALRMSVFQVRIFHGACISRSHTGTANRFSVFPESSLFQLPQDFRIVLRSYIFSFKKAVHDIMCIMS